MTKLMIKKIADGYYAGKSWKNKNHEQIAKRGWKKGFTYLLNNINDALRSGMVCAFLPSKDVVMQKGFNKANSSEYDRRKVIKDADDDLYYTGWMDCFDWLSKLDEKADM